MLVQEVLPIYITQFREFQNEMYFYRQNRLEIKEYVKDTDDDV